MVDDQPTVGKTIKGGDGRIYDAVSLLGGHVHDTVAWGGCAVIAGACCRICSVLSTAATASRGACDCTRGRWRRGVLLLEVMGAGVNARFDSLGFTSGGRLETYKATLRLIGEHPWFGTGQGTFADAFPAYRSPTHRSGGYGTSLIIHCWKSRPIWVFRSRHLSTSVGRLFLPC